MNIKYWSMVLVEFLKLKWEETKEGIFIGLFLLVTFLSFIGIMIGEYILLCCSFFTVICLIILSTHISNFCKWLYSNYKQARKIADKKYIEEMNL